MIHVLDLFSGVGAYSLGLERTGGFKTVAYCEIEKFPANILRKNSPDVPVYSDVRTVTGAGLRADGIVPQWIVGGWPCQGNSPAGTGLGMDDPRSGLWSEIARLAGEIRPEGLLLENSSNLLNINDGRDFGRVLGDVAALGYDAEWHCLSAAAFDAPHIRDRVWIIAARADANSQREQVSACGRHAAEQITDLARQTRVAPDPSRIGRQPRRAKPAGQPRRPIADGDHTIAHADRLAPIGTAIARQERVSWCSLADFRGMVHGDAEGLDGFAVTTDKVPHRVERIRALGNLNPPIIAEAIGRAILATRTGAA